MFIIHWSQSFVKIIYARWYVNMYCLFRLLILLIYYYRIYNCDNYIFFVIIEMYINNSILSAYHVEIKMLFLLYFPCTRDYIAYWILDKILLWNFDSLFVWTEYACSWHVLITIPNHTQRNIKERHFFLILGYISNFVDICRELNR